MVKWKGLIPNSYKIRFHRIFRRLVFNLPFNNLPKFLIIGVQKAGTTTLFNYLNRHPQLQGALIKEVNYFSRNTNFQKGLSWYAKHFKSLFTRGRHKIYFEASPDYIIDLEYLKRIFQFDQNIKLIVILRDPVSRAFSAWNFFRKFKRYSNLMPDFKACVDREIKVMTGLIDEDEVTQLGFLRKGFYVDQLRNCFSIFDRNSVLVLMTDDLRKQPIALLNRTLSFLGVLESDWYFLKDKSRNIGVYESYLDAGTRTELKNLFDIKNRELEILLGVKLNW